MTWKGKDREGFRRAWRAADSFLLEQGVCSYLEGEVVALDAVLDAKAKETFEPSALDEYCPLARHADASVVNVFNCPVVDRRGVVIGHETRVLPFLAKKRPLRPCGCLTPGQGPRSARAGELFRISEVHLTLRRNGMDPRLLALLTALGLSDPIIPKLVVDERGRALSDADGKPQIVEDMPMTLQAVEDSAIVVAFFDLLVKRVLFEIGGVGQNDIPRVERTSIKFELAPLFGFYDGRSPDGALRRPFDPRLELPMVVAGIEDGSGRALTTAALVERGAEVRSIGGEPLGGDSRRFPAGLSGFWARLHRESGWHRAWTMAASPGQLCHTAGLS
jgi:hypothetical protein